MMIKVFTALALSAAVACAADDPAVDESWLFKRVGGDLERTVVYEAGVYRSGTAKVNTPLPDGYPRPTPPGAIELKNYPAARRAEVTSSLNADMGMMAAFYPLFFHIQARDIAMTAPVEMGYAGWPAAEGVPPSEWTMSFLYRSPDMGATGAAERGVVVRDVEAMTVVSLGIAGSPDTLAMQKSLETLGSWLEGQDEWEACGDARGFFYNGPMDPPRTRWSEAQIPVRRIVKE